MHLIAPDILREAQGLSLLPCLIALGIGFCLWMWGWRAHRFWIVFTATLSAGIYGLSIGPAHGTPSMVAGLLMAIAAGALALDAIRLIAFLAGAATAMTLSQRFMPNWNEPFLFFFLGGFLALLLFRYWMMALFSFLGAMINVHAGLCLWHRLKKIDMVEWSSSKGGLLDTAIIVSTVLGLMIQFYFDRRQRKKSEQDEIEIADEEPKKRGWFKFWRKADSDDVDLLDAA